MPNKIWKVVDKVDHDDGGVTLTLRDEFGNVRIENFPPGATVERLERPPAGDEDDDHAE